MSASSFCPYVILYEHSKMVSGQIILLKHVRTLIYSLRILIHRYKCSHGTSWHHTWLSVWVCALFVLLSRFKRAWCVLLLTWWLRFGLWLHVFLHRFSCGVRLCFWSESWWLGVLASCLLWCLRQEELSSRSAWPAAGVPWNTSGAVACKLALLSPCVCCTSSLGYTRQVVYGVALFFF